MGLGWRVAQPVAQVIDVGVWQRGGHQPGGDVVQQQAAWHQGHTHACGHRADDAVELVHLRPGKRVDAFQSV